MSTPRKDEDRAGTDRPGLSLESLKGLKKRPGLLIVLALAAGLLFGYLVSRQFPGKPVPPPAPQANATAEEYRAGELEQHIRAVDEALQKSLAQVTPEAALQVQSVESRQHAGRAYLFQTIRLPQADVAALRKVLVKELAALAPPAKLADVSPTEWSVVIDGVHTHRLLLPGETEKPAPAPQAKARLTLIIDDLGEDVGFARNLAALGVPVVFSIWPDSTSHEAVLKIAKASGREILIHLPMQPKGYPTINPGKNPLLVTMTAEQIKNTVYRAAAQVHGAIGLNNHMGSEFTESSIGMRVALQAMQDKGLFFLDSRTTAKSVGEEEAKRLGLRHYHRDVFLDNEQNAQAILLQLRRAEGLAKSRGQAIAIGHPHPETLKALKLWLKDRDPAVAVVTLTSLAPE